MIWGNDLLKDYIESNGCFETYDGCVNPASINLRLGNTWAVLKSVNGVIQLGDKVEYNTYAADSFIIRPGEFVLATTMEYINVPRSAAAFVQGRSSIGRIGLSVQNAGYVDPGFCGNITLELKNDSPNCIRLLTGYPVAQLVYFDVTECSEPYRGKYQGQIDVTGSKIELDNFDPVSIVIKTCENK